MDCVTQCMETHLRLSSTFARLLLLLRLLCTRSWTRLMRLLRNAMVVHRTLPSLAVTLLPHSDLSLEDLVSTQPSLSRNPDSIMRSPDAEASRRSRTAPLLSLLPQRE